MPLLQLPQCPPSLKPIQHYLKTAAEHEDRDPVISYWCRLYSLQTALKIDGKSDAARTLLMKLVEWLEKQKKVLADNEAITNDIAAQAHVENYALKLFNWADGQDRSGIFNKNVVKAFYTAGMLMDVLTTFGELGDDIVRNCKYAKWKAAYIHNCLKNGETPTPGPVGWNESANDELEDNLGGQAAEGGSNLMGFNYNERNESPPKGTSPEPFHSFQPSFPSVPDVQNPSYPPAVSPDVNTQPASSPVVDFNYQPIAGSGGVKLEAHQITKAQKYCKFAASALNYDDVPEAINNLQKALKLLQTGQDS